MSCRFSIPFSGKPGHFISQAKNALESQNGSFIGDESGGNFDVTALGSTVKGSYTVTGQNLDINIESKNRMEKTI